MSDNKNTILHTNPFWVLGVTTRDDRRKIVEMAEERSLHIDHELCQLARSKLTNPRLRLCAELAWMPGVAPRVTEKLVKALLEEPDSARSENGLPELARANLMAAAFELIEEAEPAHMIAQFILDFAWLVEKIDHTEVLRDVNEDRAVSGFPAVTGVEIIEEELVSRRKAYKSTLKMLLDTMDPLRLIETMTHAVSLATCNGGQQGPALIDELVDAYELETRGFLEKEHENILLLIESVRREAPSGEQSIAPLIVKLGKVARNWDLVAQPIQLSAKSRGIDHTPSNEVANELRILGIDLNNKHGMLEQAHRMTELLSELFAELPELVEKLEEDAEVIRDLRREALERGKKNEQWNLDITFSADVGVMFKDNLSISPLGVRWKGSTYPLETITHVRWGSVRKSLNGIPTGTDYTIGFSGTESTDQVIQLKKESTYAGFIEALWRAVCVRLIFSVVEQLENGLSMNFGDMTIEDGAVTLIKHKFFGSNERVRLGWHEVHVWSADGNFIIGKQGDNKVYGSASYISHWNTHLLEHIVRGGFKKGVRNLSDYLKD